VRGEKLAQANRWTEALIQYEEADRRNPAVPGLQEAMAQARAQVVAKHHASAESALAANDWRAAFAALDDADDVQPGLPRTRELGMKAAEGLIGEAEASLRANRPEPAYELAGDLHRRLPDHRAVPSLRQKARDQVLARVEKLAGLAAWPEALDNLTVIEAFEPDRTDVTERVRQDLRTRWATRLRDDAKNDVRAGRWGPALVRQAQAAVLTGSRADLAERDRIRDRLMATYGPRLGAKIQGAPEMIDAVSRQLAQSAGPLWSPDLKSATIAWTVDAPAPACTESVLKKAGEAQVVVGKEPSSNPAFKTVSDDLANLQRTLAEAERAEVEALRRLDPLRKAVDTARVPLNAGITALENAERAETDAQAKVETAGAALEAAATAAGTDPANAGLTGAMSAYRDAVRNHQRLAGAAMEARRRYQAAANDHGIALRNLDAQSLALARASEQVTAARNRVAAQETTLASTPPVVDRDKIEVVRYGIDEITARCQTRVSVREGAAERRLEGQSMTVDTAHDAVIAAGLNQDPYRPSPPVADLPGLAISDVLKDLHTATVERLTQWRDDAQREATALRARDADKALALDLAVYLHDPKSEPRGLAQQARDVFGLASLDALVK
jgi:hypothetical protein